MTMKTKNLSLIKTNWTETCRSVPLELQIGRASCRERV